MKIGIAGYGRMGRLIHKKALEKGYRVPVIIDPHSSDPQVTGTGLEIPFADLDVIIDFTNPEVVLDNIKSYANLKIPAVIGTTGWYAEMYKVKTLVEESGTALIWSGNFSLGVNLFFQIVQAAGKVMDSFSEYDPMVHEYHHRHKADCPSGTAEMIGQILLKEMARKSKVATSLDGHRLEEDELHISATRGGYIPGTHQVIFDGEIDTISLEHCARNRNGFAEGALFAAEWIVSRRGFYHIDDLMQSIIGGVEDR